MVNETTTGVRAIDSHGHYGLYRVKEASEMKRRFTSGDPAAVLSHSGDPNGLTTDFVPFADHFPEVTLILAHLGNSGDTGTSQAL